MSKIIFISAVISSGLITACAGNSVRRSSPSVVKSPHVLEVERKNKEREEAMQDSKDQRLVLAKKASLAAAEAAKRPSIKKVVIDPVIAPPDSKLSERDLYAELVKSYDMNNEIRFFSRYQAFMRSYGKGPLADDAIYLAGLFSLSNKNYGPSLKYFNLIIRQYPSSDKASGALFAKGVALKKMNLGEESKQIFAQVQKKYPGSPEALRAEGELKILKR